MVKTEICMVKDPEAPESREILRRAARILKSGGLVVFPTETVYGLGADATDSDAAGRIYAAKGRPADNPLIVHVASADDVSRYAVETEESRRLMQVFWPGPLTVVLPARETIPSTVTAGLPTVAIRCPSHPVARALLMEVGIPIAAPSANLSGSPSPTCARHVADDMMGRVDMILDGGDCEIGLESTIVMPDKDGGLTLLRPGAVTPESGSWAIAGRHRTALSRHEIPSLRAFFTPCPSGWRLSCAATLHRKTIWQYCHYRIRGRSAATAPQPYGRTAFLAWTAAGSIDAKSPPFHSAAGY